MKNKKMKTRKEYLSMVMIFFSLRWRTKTVRISDKTKADHVNSPDGNSIKNYQSTEEEKNEEQKQVQTIN